MKGTITFGDRNVPIDIYSKEPDKRISFTHTPTETASRLSTDMKAGWAFQNPLREMHGPDIDAAAMDADLQFAAHLKAMFSEAKVQGREKIDGHDAYLVVGLARGRRRCDFILTSNRDCWCGWFDWEKLRWEVANADRLCRLPGSGGVKIPFRWTLARPSGLFTIQVSRCEAECSGGRREVCQTSQRLRKEQKGPAK
jgi:hypothetical protein